jgi:hypothetical protein
MLREFENRMPKKIFWRAIEAVSKQRLRKLSNCLMKSFMICTSPNIIRVVNSRSITCVEHMTRAGENRRAYDTCG